MEVDFVRYAKVEHVVASRTLKRQESGKILTNLGAAGNVTLTLPQDAKAGDRFRFHCMAAQTFRAEPGAAGAIYFAAAAGAYAKQADAKYAEMNALGEFIDLVADGNGDWIALDQSAGNLAVAP